MTTGWTKRSDLEYSDPFVKVFDLRSVKPLPPIHFSPGPFLCKFHPTLHGSLLVVSQLGNFQFFDLIDQGNLDPNIYQVFFFFF